ncbi:UNVERIFIED_CONTAM: Retrovirus-related Pol polyprotein from transposon RE2 [Sesamum calycinum]|uniref:Retrovirus-related Pol polyprotein from transposon RE2 n=1 Tax=Sesamum calycinum TaxID=2727403 RepID=A0AAW2Q2U1_9LAMI
MMEAHGGFMGLTTEIHGEEARRTEPTMEMEEIKRNLRIVLDFENQTYVLDKSLAVTLSKGSRTEERVTFKRWHEDNGKVRSIVLASMTNDIQKQYDRHDDVASIMLRMKEVYAVSDRHVRYVVTKAFFGTKMTEGSSVQEQWIKMLSLVEKLEDLQAGLDNDTYIDVILQSLLPSYDPYVINYNMSGFEKFINELINMLVQYEAMTKKSEPSVLIGEASISKVKGKGARRWKRKKGKAKATASALSSPIAPMGMGKGKGNVVSKSIRTNDVLDTGYGAHICNDLQVLERSRKLNRDEVVLKLGDGKAVAAEAPMRYKFEAFGRFKGFRLEVKTKLVTKSLRSDLDTISDMAQHAYVLQVLESVGSPTYVKRLVGDKLDSRSSLCRCIADTRREELLLEESSEATPQTDAVTSSAPIVPNNDISVLQRLTRVWTLVDPPKGVKPIGFKWVYKHKLAADEEVPTFKAKLVEKGYTQRPRVNFEETYSLVAMAKSIQIVLAIAA